MSRRYASVSPRFWTGQTGKELRAAGCDAQMLALYVVTSPHANMLGLYHLPVSYICTDTGLSADAVRRGLVVLEDLDFARYDDTTEHVWVITMARHQVLDGRPRLKARDNQAIAAQNRYAELSDNAHLGPFFDVYADVLHLKSCRGVGAPRKALRSSSGAPSKPGTGTGTGTRTGIRAQYVRQRRSASPKKGEPASRGKAGSSKANVRGVSVPPSPTPSSVGASSRSLASSATARMPMRDDFALTDTGREYARSHYVDAEHEEQAFRDFYGSEKGRKVRDTDEGWHGDRWRQWIDDGLRHQRVRLLEHASGNGEPTPKPLHRMTPSEHDAELERMRGGRSLKIT